MTAPKTPRVRRTTVRDSLDPKTAPRAQYDAAGTGRRLRGWSPPTSGPNRAIKGLQKIRDRADDSVRNDWAGASIVQKWTTTLVGIGITARFDRIEDRARRKVIADLFSDFVQYSDADGILNLFGQQTLAVRSWLSKGEVFVRERPRDASLPLPVPVQLQMLEAEFVPLLDADSWPGLPQGNRIRQGIELNKYDRRIAYWMYKEHPGDGALLSRTPGSTDLVRVPAATVWHIFEPIRPGQLRGVSGLAQILVRLRMAGDFEDAVLDRQRLANLFTIFITRQIPPENWGDLEIDGLTGLPKAWGDDQKPIAGLEPGISQELNPGEDVKFANPPEPGVVYPDYLRATHLGTAAGAGMPYEIMSGDIRNISDRALRVILNEYYRFADQRQWQIIVPMFCQKAVDAFAKYAAISGKISLEEIDLVRRCTHSPHGRAYIHPTQDVQGKILEINAGIAARSDIISAKGDDPEAIDEKRMADGKRNKAILSQTTPPKVAP
jgi:lambda family phage portal protein